MFVVTLVFKNKQTKGDKVVYARSFIQLTTKCQVSDDERLAPANVALMLYLHSVCYEGIRVSGTLRNVKKTHQHQHDK